MDTRRAFDRFERSGAGWLPLALMIITATALTSITLAGVGSVPPADSVPPQRGSLPAATMENTADE